MAGLAPGADPLLLAHGVPECERIAAAAGPLSIEMFRGEGRSEPGAAPDTAV